MKNTLFVLILGGLLIAFCGCGKKDDPAQTPAPSETSIGAPSMAPSQMSTVEAKAKAAAIKISPIEYAQKEYLDSYNEYVRLLRESGPQTIETLQALAIYQKKYQIYQMLLQAEGDKKP
ncbi:MAG: hypothetical protein PHV05_04480 [Candidatus Riflebacteria bacterium]|nr:hypothetical protein [Candidatus Riflebacteria bacterium]